MLVFFAFLLAIIPAIAILYPFLRRKQYQIFSRDEPAREATLSQRWDAAMSGLDSVELEWSVGDLDESEYLRLRNLYMTEAALVMKAMGGAEAENGITRAATDRRSVEQSSQGAGEGSV